MQLFVKIIGISRVPLAIYYSLEGDDNHVGLILFVVRFGVVIVFSHMVGYRIMARHAVPLTIQCRGSVFLFSTHRTRGEEKSAGRSLIPPLLPPRLPQ